MKAVGYPRTISYIHLHLPDVCYVSGPRKFFLVERGGGGGGVVEVIRHHSRTLAVISSVYVILVNSVAVKIYKAIKVNIGSIEWEGALTLCSCLIGLSRRCQVIFRPG